MNYWQQDINNNHLDLDADIFGNGVVPTLKRSSSFNQLLQIGPSRLDVKMEDIMESEPQDA